MNLKETRLGSSNSLQTTEFLVSLIVINVFAIAYPWVRVGALALVCALRSVAVGGA